jgi:orotidine-5'-phosphate decarboxylase
VWEALTDIDQAEAVWFADNNPARQGGRFLWLDVLAPSQIAERGFDAVVIGSMSRDPIRRQLRELGIEDFRILAPDVGAPTEQIQEQLVTALVGTVRQEVRR